MLNHNVQSSTDQANNFIFQKQLVKKKIACETFSRSVQLGVRMSDNRLIIQFLMVSVGNHMAFILFSGEVSWFNSHSSTTATVL